MKELPYFKFYTNEWITGDITFLDYESQGLFINLCAYYWSKDATLTLKNAKRKFSDVNENCFDQLIESDIIKINDDKIIIKFLDEQRGERGKLSVTNSKNGSKGGRPKKQIESEIKPTALFIESETITKKSNIEEKREEEKRKEEINLLPFGIDFLIHWKTWIGYKQSQHKFKYKELSTEQIAFNDLVNKSNSDKLTAIAIINNSIVNGWKSLQPLKNSYVSNQMDSQTINKSEPRAIGTTHSMFL
jgi:hypothetical protein